MLKKPCDFTASQCMIWMFTFNPGKINIYPCRNFPQHLVFLVPFNQLKFPEGWYYSEITKTIINESSNITVSVVILE